MTARWSPFRLTEAALVIRPDPGDAGWPNIDPDRMVFAGPIFGVIKSYRHAGFFPDR